MTESKPAAKSVEISLAPIPFHWPEEKWRDFYYRVADSPALDTVFIGETICSKRAPFTTHLYADVAQRLIENGKKVVFSTLGEVSVPIDRKLIKSLCTAEDFQIEANDASALYALTGRPHAIGPLLNVYNEDAMIALADRGATRFSVQPELPARVVGKLAQTAHARQTALEVQVFGRMSLALSARCYHARAHGRIKDNCQFVCEQDPDGMDLNTISGRSFLAINGIQTMSYSYLNLIHELAGLQEMGIHAFRITPHSRNSVETISIFRDVAEKQMDSNEGHKKLVELYPDVSFSNGFYHHKSGHAWVVPSVSESAA